MSTRFKPKKIRMTWPMPNYMGWTMDQSRHKPLRASLCGAWQEMVWKQESCPRDAKMAIDRWLETCERHLDRIVAEPMVRPTLGPWRV